MLPDQRELIDRAEDDRGVDPAYAGVSAVFGCSIDRFADPELPAYLVHNPLARSENRVKAVTGCTNRSPIAADAIEDEVQEALAICGGDAIAALRITLIANAFLEAEIDRLSAAVSSGFARGKVRKAPKPKEGKEKNTR